jgi:CelD/BcsL family acetyltransferase involved in cellulose biosynthesis
MKVEWIKSYEDLDRLSGEWNKLLRQSNSDSIFLTWEWVSTCLEATDISVELCTVAVRNESGLLVCIAPLCIQRFTLLRLIPVNILRPITALIKASEYPDIICHRDHEDSAYRVVFEALRGLKGWDLIWFQRVAKWTGASARLKNAALETKLRHKERPFAFSTISLPNSFNDFFSTMSSRTKTQVRTLMRHFTDNSVLEFEQVSDKAKLSEALNALDRLNERRWNAVGQQGVFQRSPTELRFHEIFARTAIELDWLRLYVLRDPDGAVAAQIGYRYNKKYMQVQEGFDPDVGSGNGNLLRGLCVSSLIAEETMEYDFLGGQSDHKRRWGAHVRQGCHIQISRPNSYWMLLFALGIWPSGRFTHPAKNS